MSLRLIFLGPPGVGKGTQAALASAHFGIPQVATGDILREAVRQGTELGLAAQASMDRGELVADSVVVGIVDARTRRKDCERGFLLDGFPRTVPQAEALDALLAERGTPLQVVLLLVAPEEELISRLASRWACGKCGRTYPDPRREAGGRCEADSEPLYQRPDDRPEVVRTRLQVYRKQTQPLVEYFRRRGLIREVDGMGDVAEVHRRIREVLAQAEAGR